MPESDEISRVAKGARPSNFPDEPLAERLLAMFSALVTEVGVLCERLDTIEHLAEQRGQFTQEDIEQFKPDLATLEARERWRRAYLDRVLEVLQKDAES